MFSIYCWTLMDVVGNCRHRKANIECVVGAAPRSSNESTDRFVMSWWHWWPYDLLPSASIVDTRHCERLITPTVISEYVLSTHLRCFACKQFAALVIWLYIRIYLNAKARQTARFMIENSLKQTCRPSDSAFADIVRVYILHFTCISY